MTPTKKPASDKDAKTADKPIAKRKLLAKKGSQRLAGATKTATKGKVAGVRTEGLKRDVDRKTKSVRRAERGVTSTAVLEPPVEPEIYAPDVEEQEYTDEEHAELMAMYDGTLSDIKEGEIVKGTVLAVTRDDVIVDVGFKSEGVIPIGEFPEPDTLEAGSEIEVFLDAVEDQNGQLVLSKRKADFMRVWDRIREAYEAGVIVDGKLQRRIKGGIVVDLFGVDAFLPGSQIALRQVADFDSLIGQALPMRIIKLNKSRRNIVVSRRVVLEEEREAMRDTLLKEIAGGQEREGTVKNITDFGVFIDLGGVDGLLHITDMSWGRIKHPSELVSVGETIKVRVLEYDEKSTRISLGLKQMTPHPWENVEEKYPIGSKIEGRVVSITDYGAFVELEKGVEGLVHISEMSWTHHVRHPSKIVSVNEIINAMVLNIDKEHQKISLGIKQLEPDPWESVINRYPIGSKHEGVVRNLTAFGAFVELEEGIDGLVHISDMSWTKRIQHPSEIMKKGENATVIVLNVDQENRKISLGLKQLTDDPWPTFHERFRVGVEVAGLISRLLERGVVVELDGDVEGFVPFNQLGKHDIQKPEDAFSVGETINLRVIEFDPTNRRIVLSVDAYYQGRDQAELDEFLSKHDSGGVAMGELAGVVASTPPVEEPASEPPTESDTPPIDESASETPTDGDSPPATETSDEPATEASVPSEPETAEAPAVADVSEQETPEPERPASTDT